MASEEAYQEHTCEGNAIICPKCRLGFGSWYSFKQHEKHMHSWSVRDRIEPRVSPTQSPSKVIQAGKGNLSGHNNSSPYFSSSGHGNPTQSSAWDTSVHNLTQPVVGDLLDLDDDEMYEAQVDNTAGGVNSTSEEGPQPIARNRNCSYAVLDMKSGRAVPEKAELEKGSTSGSISASTLDQQSLIDRFHITTVQTPRRVSAVRHRIICFQCEAGFSTIIGLQHHQMTENHNYCGLCHAYFADGTFLDKHMEVAHNFKCPTCASVFASIGDVWAHQQTTEHSFCSVCRCYFQDESAQSKHNLMYHMRMPCPTCQQVFQTQKELEEHQRASQHSYCGQCDEIMGSQSSFETHVTTSHTYKCTAAKCLFAAAKLDVLKDHQKREKHNFCLPCNRSFTDALALTNHSKTEKHLRKERIEQSENSQASG
ncbi:hypothetical protein MGYG_06413 [Nannizzia gypsea CBS 118893]|uniref:C2H2-type domain-containing protein n=1 Tax=Arthroderma gypseum (strain ATCC MYA-4604 / CBS 118893) TaxID=535722 RepID=E4UZ85_ARTGP|nr:hypothetical protein MGYG_06413 [Nannizzia gypsea CBS 118893]EFR03415.1 hypothetical protein MGYG_06413 [Nannizzia gypsea CBS 118893]